MTEFYKHRNGTQCTNILTAFSHTTMSSSGRKRIQKTRGFTLNQTSLSNTVSQEATDVVVQREGKHPDLSPLTKPFPLPRSLRAARGDRAPASQTRRAKEEKRGERASGAWSAQGLPALGHVLPMQQTWAHSGLQLRRAPLQEDARRRPTRQLRAPETGTEKGKPRGPTFLFLSMRSLGIFRCFFLSLSRFFSFSSRSASRTFLIEAAA